MIALYIILGVLAAIIIAIVILLHFSVKAYIEADNKHFSVYVKYLGFSVYKLRIPDKDKPEKSAVCGEAPEKPQPQADSPDFELTEIPESDSTEYIKTDDNKDEPLEAHDAGDSQKSGGADEEDDDKSRSDEKDESGEPTLLEKFNAVKKYIPAGKKAFRKLLKLIRFYDFTFELTYGADDPYKTGMNFGRINAVFYNVLALLCCVFSVKIDHTDIKCDFDRKTADFFVKTAVYVRPSAVVCLAAYVGIYYLIIRSKLKKLENKSKKENKHE